MRAVPGSLREASYGLGAKQWRTAFATSCFRAAISGIIAALILGIARAVGETMVVALAAGLNGIMALQPHRGWSDHDRRDRQPGCRFRSGGRRRSRVSSRCCFVGLVLFVLTLGLNVVSGRIVRRSGRGTDMAVVTPALTPTDVVRHSIEGRHFSPINTLVAFTMLFTLLSSVVILITLLADTIAAALPVFASRGLGFVTASLSPTAASAGIWQGSWGRWP